MRIYREKDYAAMSRRAANLISAEVIRRPDCVLGLATGSTPIGTYKQLIEWNKKGDLSFKEVHTVNLDEYKGLSADHDQSYRYFMQHNLFDHIDIVPENTYVPNGLAEDAEAECRNYDELVRSFGYADLQLLIASGADKAEAIYQAVCGPITPQCPASILQLHSDVVIVGDEAALSKLEGTGVEICG